MTKEELKEKYPMNEIVSRYGLRPNRAGFISCPFHKENTASMKIYPDSYYCFGCGDGGDIFSFVMKMENLTFKEAYLSLGGSYEKKESFRSKLNRYHICKDQDMVRKQKEQRQWRKELNNMLIDIYREFYLKSEPFSETWVSCYNALQYQLYMHEILNEERAGS